MTFSYNGRHLVTGINYDVSAAPGVTATANVSYGYNAAGNRTAMTDGLGSVSYVYDQLSRLTSESRTFTGLGSFGLSYEYNLAGELTKITNPWSAQVSYNYDKTGRPISVGGAGYAGLTSYVNNITYRAFGAPKQLAYANGRALSLSYNNRLQLSRWELPQVGGGGTSTTALGYAYQYESVGNSGRVSFADSLYDSTLDRSWTYDHVGRLVSAYTGKEANAIWGAPDGPYAQSFGYDVWGNRTHREGWGGIYGSYTNDNPTFSNNKQVGQTYDAAGNYTAGGTVTYNAMSQVVSYSGGGGGTHAFDGDRLRGKKTESGVTTYYLRSSVLGGQVVAEINASAVWQRGYVYLGGSLVALQYNAAVTWVHQEPFSKGQRFTNGSGTMTSTVIEVDPFGGETARTANGAFQPQRYTTYTRDADGGDEAMHRRYSSYWSRFNQPDPYDGSYSLADPQSFNRYSYVQSDPVNFVDPSGLQNCAAEFNATGACTIGDGGSGVIDAGFLRFLIESLTRSFGGGGGGGDSEGGGGGGGGQTGRTNPQNPDATKTYSRDFDCNKAAKDIFHRLRTHFPKLANFAGNFGPGGLATAIVSFGSTPITKGASISINNVNLPPPGTNLPALSISTSVTVQSVSTQVGSIMGFTFGTVPGHVLYPATISFTPKDIGSGNVNFSINVNGQFAGKLYHGLYLAGGGELENKIWNNLIDNIERYCGHEPR